MTVLCVEYKDSLDLQAMTNQPSKFAWANQGFRRETGDVGYTPKRPFSLR
jgi:hypothetical protein